MVLGQFNAEDEIRNSGVIPMEAIGRDGSGIDPFGAVIKPSARTGRHGYSIRVLPKNPDLISSLPAEEDGLGDCVGELNFTGERSRRKRLT